MPFENARKQVKESISKMKISKIEKESLYEILSNPNKVHQFNLKIKLDNGKIKNFVAFRSQHNNLAGPYKGGIRFHHNVSENEVKALSTWMTMKTSVLGLPLGGGKGGIIVNPKELSKNELEKLSRSYVQSLYKEIGPDVDIPAPDVNTNGEIMSWMNDEYQKLTGSKVLGTFTGKPLELGGSLGRPEATGFGGIKVLETFLQEENTSLKKKKVIIQGFGNVGTFAAIRLLNKHSIIIGLSDSKSAIIKEDGFTKEEIEYFIKTKEENRISLECIEKSLGIDGVEVITNEELLKQQCDILIPSALENVITKENANEIKAKIVLELANGPVTPEADKILLEKDITVIPDILANSGGVLVSYFEQIQNKTGDYWEKDFVIEKMDKLLIKQALEVLDIKKEEKLDFRTSAYLLSIKKIYKIAKIKNIL